MIVGIRLQAILRRYRPAGWTGDVIEVEVPEIVTARDAAARLGVPENLIHAVFINNRQATLDTRLSPGDVVRLFPPVAGGSF